MDRRKFLQLPVALPVAATLTLTTPDGEAFDVSVLRLQPGDVIVLACPGPISDDTAQRLRNHMEKAFPNQRAMVLGDGMRIDGIVRDV